MRSRLYHLTKYFGLIIEFGEKVKGEGSKVLSFPFPIPPSPFSPPMYTNLKKEYDKYLT
ncbi:hypothetical protein FDUTEX481_05610 [Tolypothrix sp. PCC 7601]|nr:hypothetical protein FDUTEX481_05610 [Tolypothrix sp. PCC 7601]